MRFEEHEVRFLAGVIDASEFSGPEIRRVASASRRLRWLQTDEGVNPGGEDELIGFARAVVSQILDGKMAIPGSVAQIVVDLETKLGAETVVEEGAETPTLRPEGEAA